MSRSTFRLVPPAGAPVPVRAALSSLRESAAELRGLSDALTGRLGVAPPFFVSSGRAALVILLQAMRRSSDRCEVILPAYTCFSVASAVARVGLTIRLCDVDPTTLDFDFDALARLDLGRALCVVPSGLYGMPGDLVRLEGLERNFGAHLVDDAAQCLGATQDGRPCGTFGAAGFYSLGRGKGITTMGGGILVTRRPELARSIEEQLRTVRRPSIADVGAAVASSLFYSVLLRPSRYWLVDRLPFLALGATHFDPNFPIARLSAYQRRLGQQVLPLLDAYNKIRRDHADHLRIGLQETDGIDVPRPVAGTDPVYLRFPVLTRNATHRARLLARLREAGISASASYPTTISDIPGIARYLAPDQKACPAASSVASRILTLPTHPWVTPADVQEMVTIIRRDAELARVGYRA